VDVLAALIEESLAELVMASVESSQRRSTAVEPVS
jgi:hypothetical protein